MSRSEAGVQSRLSLHTNARVVELVDTLDLKSNDHCGRAGSSPASSTKPSLEGFLFSLNHQYSLCIDASSCKHRETIFIK